jgi:hypothetical protein
MANKLGDLYTQLKQTIVGTKTQQIDTSLDKAVKDIITYKSHSGRNGYIDLVKSIISKATVGYTVPGTGGGIYTSASSGPAAFGQGARLMRYKLYDSIVMNINYAHRALKTITDNILAPDDITKVSLEIKPKKYLEDEIPTQAKVRRVKEVIKVIKLEEKLDVIVWNTLLFGDFFCEIAQSRAALTSRSIINESQYLHHVNQLIKSGARETWTNEYMDYKDKKRDLKISIDYSSFMDEQDGHSMFSVLPGPDSLPGAQPKDFDSDKLTDDSEGAEKKAGKRDIDVEEKKLKNLNLVFHRANCVIKLQSSLFPICFGYLVFPQIKGFSIPGNPLEDEMVNNICRSILTSLEKKIPQMAEFQDNDELMQIIFHMVKKTSPMQALEIRFVPPDKMIHFMVPSTKYFPYGESIFDASQYSAKVLMALETSLAIQRLSRSTEKRKIAIEIGLPRDARKAIESMKEEFRKRKVSLDSFGTIDTIPSMITTFEDVYIPQKDGKPFVDISSFDEGRIDTRGKVDELKFMRDQLTANWGVPPSFLGIEENLSNKASLSEENIIFARSIITHQKYLNVNINELIEKIFKIVDPEEILLLKDSVLITLPGPKTLQYERESRFLNEVIGLIESLERIGVPKEYSKKKYLPQFDWDEIKKYEIDSKVEKNIDPTQNQDQFGGMGGGMGGGFGGAPTGGGYTPTSTF